MIRTAFGRMLAFTAVFAVSAGFVFYGTWALDMVPVMPDCATSFPLNHIKEWCAGWIENGKAVPTDAIVFLGSPYFWVEMQYALSLYLAALGMVFFMTGRGLKFLPSAVSALLLVFCGYWLTLFSAGHLGWFRWMSFGVFAFGFADRAIMRGRWLDWALLGATLAWGSFYQPDLWLLFTVFTFAYFIYRLFATRPPAKRFFAGAAVSLAVFTAIGWPSFRSAFVNDLAGRDAQIERGETITGNAEDEAQRRWIFTTNWSMPPEDTLEFAIPRIHGDTSCPLTLAVNSHSKGVVPYSGRLGRPLGADSGNYRQHSLYVGIPTLAFAFAAIFFAFKTGRRRADTVFFASCAVVFWLFSMGRYVEPVYRCVFAMPFGDYLRAPVKWHHLTEFCLAALAGFGFSALWEMECRRARAVRIAICVFAAAGLADLVRTGSLYCAPHSADTELVPVTQQPIPDNPAQEKAFRAAATRAGLKPVGTMTMPARLRDGSIRDFRFLVVEQRQNRSAGRAEMPKMKAEIAIPATISILASLAVLGSLAYSYWRGHIRTSSHKEKAA